jgi:hypothetical protein
MPSQQTASFAAAKLASDEGVRTEVTTGSLFTTLKSRLRQVSIDGETYYVAEGDTLLDVDQLAIYAFSREKEDEAFRAAQTASDAGLGISPLAPSVPRGLLGMTQDGKIVRWAPQVILTYRVARQMFTTEDRYNLAVECMQKATGAWEDTCGIKFEHQQALDARPGADPAGAIFSVREIDANGSFIAASFFPNDPPVRRRVLIDPSFYSDNVGFDRVGVLRHELGHVLGFRHEHIRSGAPPVCPQESTTDTIDLTKYDPQSVMHYFCGGVGSRTLAITALDRDGSQRVYGPPLHSTSFVGA